MTLNEQDIIAHCQKGDLSQFTLLYDNYIQPIYRFVYSRVWDKGTAEDLTSQTFLDAMEGIQKYRAEAGAFKSWLYTIARNVIIDHIRRQRPQSSLDDVLELPSATNLEVEIDQKVSLERIQKELKILTPEQKEIVILRVWHDLSYTEIAHILGKKEDAIKVSYCRSIAKIRTEILLLLICFLSTHLT